MDSECDDLLFGDLFTKNGTTMEELLDYVHLILQEDPNEMNPNATTANLDNCGVSVAPAEPEALLDNRPEPCEASYTTVRNEPSEFVTENRLPSLVSTQQASHAERNSSTQCRASIAKRKRQETHNNVVSDGGTQVVKRRCRWSDDEHERFLRGILKYGKSNWKDIANKEVRTRTSLQVSSHAQKYFSRQVQTNKMRSSINDVSVELKPSKCLSDTPESSSAAARRHSGCPFNNVPDPRYDKVRLPPAVIQPSSITARQNFNVIAPRYIPAQRNPANFLQGERNFGGLIQPQHLEEQYYPPVMMQLPAPQHLPAQWNPNNFPVGGNIWPVQSPSAELPYYLVATPMFPGQRSHL